MTGKNPDDIEGNPDDDDGKPEDDDGWKGRTAAGMAARAAHDGHGMKR
jgi:hypothetical protein